MPPVGFEPTISAGERPQTYALDHAAIGDRHTPSYEMNLLTSGSSRNIRRVKPISGTAYTYSYEGGDGENTVLIPSYFVIHNLWPTNEHFNIDIALPPYCFAFYKSLTLMKLEWSRFQQHRISESYSKFYWCLRPDLLTENCSVRRIIVFATVFMKIPE
jgi:hypothetical protein